MASYSVAVAKSASLSTTTADTITFTAPRTHVCIYNDDTATKMYATLGVDGFTATTPTSAADDTYVIPPKMSLNIDALGVVTSCKVVGNGNAYTAQVS